MAVAHELLRACDAVREANVIFSSLGRPLIPIARERQFAGDLADLETITCLREPARQLVTLLHNRSADLRREEAVTAALNAEIDANATWGMF